MGQREFFVYLVDAADAFGIRGIWEWVVVQRAVGQAIPEWRHVPSQLVDSNIKVREKAHIHQFRRQGSWQFVHTKI